jgi:iron complex outermembrane receptor protein
VPFDSVELPVNNVDGADGHWWGSEIFLRISPFERHTVTVGSEARVNTRQDQWNFDAAPLAVYTDISMTSHNLGFYLQDEVTVLDNLLLNIGARHDYYSTFGGTTHPRLGIVYSPYSTTTLKALYGSAFRAPNAYEMYYCNSPDLKPEAIHTGELVVEHYLGDHYRFAGSGFLSHIENLITQTINPLDGETRFVNAADIASRGLELEAHARWAFGVEALLSFTHQRTYHRDTRQALSNSPSNVFKANVSAPLLRNILQAGLEVQHTGRRLTIRGEHVGLNTIANFTLSTPRPLGGVSASVSMYNLFDARYGDPGSEEHVQKTIEQDGRTFRLRIGYAF